MRVVPGGMQPGAAIGYLFGAMAGAFAACGLSSEGIAGSAAGVEACDRDAAAELGRQLAGSVPLVYGTGPLGAIA